MMPTLALTLLQTPSGIAINGELPLLGVILAVIGAVAAFVAVRQKMESHEKSDDQRFGAMDAMLKEIRDDVKKLIGGHASGD